MQKSQRTRISAHGLIVDSGKILLCRLSKDLPKFGGKWTLPGGGLEFGESPEEAVVREVEEETGLLVVPGKVSTINSICDRRGDEDFHGIRIIYELEVIGGTMRSEVGGTTDLCEWHLLFPTPDIELVSLAIIGMDKAREFK